MKLELKDLAPYLNHKIQVSYLDCIEDKKRNTAYLTGISLEDGIETTYKRKKKGCSGDLISWKGNNNIHDLELKLILHPLSDLNRYRENIINEDIINEHSINLLISEKYNLEYGIFIYYDGKMDIEIDGAPDLRYDSNKSISFDVVLTIQEELLKGHYDIFNLIENNLAIDINTIK